MHRLATSISPSTQLPIIHVLLLHCPTIAHTEHRTRTKRRLSTEDGQQGARTSLSSLSSMSNQTHLVAPQPQLKRSCKTDNNAVTATFNLYSTRRLPPSALVPIVPVRTLVSRIRRTLLRASPPQTQGTTSIRLDRGVELLRNPPGAAGSPCSEKVLVEILPLLLPFSPIVVLHISSNRLDRTLDHSPFLYGI